MPKSSRDALIQTLRGLLGEAFALHQKGGAGVRLGRSYGIADGYMLALIELGMATQQELGGVVAEVRAQRLGPATKTLVAPEATESPSETLAA
jgi:hypothetical protein